MNELDLFIDQDGEKLRCGFTTGSCATAAAKAAALMLIEGETIDRVTIDTPANIPLDLKVIGQKIERDYAIAGIKKNSGDDPDSTKGIEIFAKVSFRKDGEISIDGGLGIGRIKKKGLFGEVGEAAINPVPREMIREELLGLNPGGFDVLIFAPDGERIGRKTFNENIGIEGGISIIGTKGIVYPMSEDALKKTIYLEADLIRKNENPDSIVLVPGNHGEKLAKSLGYARNLLQVSNYIGDSLKYVYEQGFRDITLIGHIGKFSKLAIGIYNTHSKYADSRMEAFIYYLALMGVDRKFLEEVDSFLTAEEAYNFCVDRGYGQVINKMEEGISLRIKRYLKDDNLKISVKIYSMKKGLDR